jgi:hypothetical protein
MEKKNSPIFYMGPYTPKCSTNWRTSRMLNLNMEKNEKFFNIIVTLHDEGKDGQCPWWILPIFFMLLKLNYWLVVQFFFIFNLFHYMYCCSIKMAYSKNNYILFINLWAIGTQSILNANMDTKSCMSFITIHSKDGCRYP